MTAGTYVADESDLVEINLNAVHSPGHLDGESRYFGNLSFSHHKIDGFPYGYNESCSSKPCSTDYVSLPGETPKYSCLRQLYCSECNQRLGACDEQHCDKIFFCCLPLWAIKFFKRRRHPVPETCKKCGLNLSTEKSA